MNRLRLTLFLSAVVYSACAAAECTGNYYHSICTFDNGDTHTITKTMSSSGEEITEIKGHNKTSGATWEERTRVRGDDTITRGTAANGARWRQTKHNKGNGEYQISGVDASGNLYKYECKESECNDSY